MFYYISFLRPPPTASSTHTSLLITPQIANDLRTETCPNAHDIYYSWLPSAGLKPQKLTSWNPKNPYPKPVPVPLPSPLVLGKTYTLALSCNGSPVVPLTNVSANPLPFPVLSKPVRFYQGREEIKKQEQIDRIYTLVEKDRIIVSEQTSFDLDKKIWDSGIGLSAWLTDLYQDRSEERHQEPLVKKLRDILFAPERVDIIELGAGTGIVSLVVAALRYRLLRPQNSHHDDLPQDPSPSTIEPGRIIITDLDSAIPLLEENIKKNAALFDIVKPEAVVLDWDRCDEFQADDALPTAWDVILMADVTYNTSSFPALLRTLSSLLKPADRKSVV